MEPLRSFPSEASNTTYVTIPWSVGNKKKYWKVLWGLPHAQCTQGSKWQWRHFLFPCLFLQATPTEIWTQFQTKGSRNFCFTKSSKLTVDYYTIGSASPVHLPLPGPHRHQIPLHGSYTHTVALSTYLFLVLIAIRFLSMVRILIL